MDFLEARKEYNDCREKEKNKIIKELKKSGYEITPYFKGHGSNYYKASGEMQNPYDLSIWKWIEVKKQDKYYCISLQAFDRQNKERNEIVLFDRLGIYGPYNVYDQKDCFDKMHVTEIDLPMDDNKMKQLINSLNKVC